MWQQGSFSPLMPPHAFPRYPTVSLMPDNFNGHQIPMLSDSSNSQNSDEIPYQQPPLQPIPQGTQATLPQTGGIDWTIISSCSPEELVKTNDVETLTAIIQSFIHAKFTQTEAKLMPNPLTAKLFHILQIAIKYLLECQDELKENLDESEKAEQLLKAKLKNLSASLQHAKDEVKKSEKIKETTEKCIVCGRRFKNISYLDGHVQRRHGALVPAWRSLRSGKMQGMEDFTEQLENLRLEVAKTHRELERRAEQEAAKAPITHIVSHSDEQLRIMKELIAKQDEMLNQARLNEEKQLNFRKEMRNQLDDAVFALQDAQKQLDVQAARISQIPLIPPPVPAKPNEPIQPDELGSSLTGQIMKPGLEKQRVAFKLDNLLSDIPPSPFENEIKNDESLRPKLNLAPEDSDISKSRSKQPSDDQKKDDDEVDIKKDGIDKKHQAVLDRLQQSTETEEEEKTKTKPVNKFLSKRDQIDDLLKRGKMLVNHKVDPDEGPNRDFSLATIQEATLHQVDLKLAELKRQRPYAALSVPFVAKKMAEKDESYKKMYIKLNTFVGSEAPDNENEMKRGLFKDRKTFFPLLPPVRKLTQKQFLAQRQRQSKKQKGQDEKKKYDQQAIPSIPDEVINEAGRKLPYRQRISSSRPRLLPGDSEVEIVDKFSSEMNSDKSVGYLEDPDYYKKVGYGYIGKDLKEKEFEELHVSSPSSSSIIQPLVGGDDEKVFNLSEFSGSSDSEREAEKSKKQAKTKKPEITTKISSKTSKNEKGSKNNISTSQKKKQNDMLSENDDDDGIDAFAFSSADDDDDDNSNKKKKVSIGADMFEFEEDSNSENSTQAMPLKVLNKTKTYKAKTAGSGDFDVTKKQTMKNDSESDAMFNLSDFSDDDISSDDDDSRKKKKSRK